MNAREVVVALVCFSGKKSAGKARKPLEAALRSNGDTVLQTTVVEVDAKRKASVHDVRRVVAGTVTPALTWGLFGLVAGSNKLESTVVWAVIGAVCGGLFTYASEHVLSKSELARIGKHVPADSSALVTYVETGDAAALLRAGAAYHPSTASAVVLDANLGARVLVGAESPLGIPHGSSSGELDESSMVNMLLVRYPDTKVAGRVAKALAKSSAANAPQIELVIETDARGRRHVTDPTHGTWVQSKSDIVSWGLFGLAFGAIVGATGGGGILGFLKGGVVTGIGWAVFGLVAGALYGLWAGRSISARRLRGIGPVLPAGTSTLLAWADGRISSEALAELQRPDAKGLVLSFVAVPEGALLAAPLSQPSDAEPSRKPVGAEKGESR